MESLHNIYTEYILTGEIDELPTYCLSQDPLEIFFGKNRTHYGNNDNPTVEQFMSSYRQILMYSTVLISKDSNCKQDFEYDMELEPFSNILFTTSRRATFENKNVDPTPEELEEIYATLDRIETVQRNSLTDAQLSECAISHVAEIIETRLKAKEPNCEHCKNVFDEDEEIRSLSKPCLSTVKICKAVERFLKFELLKNKFRFDSVIYAVFSRN